MKEVTKGHKRLSAFGMSWTSGGAFKNPLRKASQTPFGFWYVLDHVFVMWHAAAPAEQGHKRLSAFGMSWTVPPLSGLRQAVYDARSEAPRFRGVFGGSFCGEPMCSRSWMPLKKNGLTRFGGTTPVFRGFEVPPKRD